MFVEDAEQLARSARSRTTCRTSSTSSCSSPATPTSATRSRSTTCASAAAAATTEELDAAHRRRVGPDDLAITIYTSGTTGPPKGCLLTHGNYRDVTSMTESMGVLEEGEVVYLFLPLAHAFAKLDPVRGDRPGRLPRLLGEGPDQDHPQPHGGQADLLPVGAADVREDLHAGHDATRRTPRSSSRRCSWALKVRLRRAQRRGGLRRGARGLRPGRRGALQERARAVRRQHPPVRDRRGADRAGDPRVLLRLRRAGDGGLRHDGDLDGGHRQHAGRLPLRLGRQAAARASRRRSPRTASCCSRARTSSRATTRTRRPRTRRWSRAGCTPATWARSTTTATSSSPAARRTSSSPRAARTSRRPTWRTGSSRTAGSPRRWWSVTGARTSSR